MFRILLFTVLAAGYYSCGYAQRHKSGTAFQPCELPDDLSKITDEHLAPILSMLDDARLIGMSEGTHGMIEPFYFRNALIKYLVEQKRISVIAIESGLVESRIAYDYVNGADISLDSAINNGIVCTFETFRHNRELLEWLRGYNADKPDAEKVHFYGFDIPGCASNPELENALSGFNRVLNYLQQVDSEEFVRANETLSEFRSLLRIKDNAEDSLDHFWNIDSTGWEKLEIMLHDLDSRFKSNSAAYIAKGSEEDYSWAFRALVGARQNVAFLHAIGNPDYNYSVRELEMFRNIEWIMEREPGESILLFAHLAHLAKEIHAKDPDQLPYPQTGEYLGEKFGDDYMVIANFYMKLDWFDGDPIVLEKSTMDASFKKFGLPNFYMKLDKTNPKWSKDWNFGKPSSLGKICMYPDKAIDIVFFNEVQTWIDAEQNK